MKPSELILNKYTVAGRRGFKSHPVRSLSTNDLSGECSKNVARQLHDNGVRRLVAALCLRAFLDRITYGTNSRHRCEKAQIETLPELESFIRHDAPKFWEAIGLNFLIGDWLLRRCRQGRNGISMSGYQTEGGAA